MRPVLGSSSSQAIGAPRHVPRPLTRQCVSDFWPVGIDLHPPADLVIEAAERQVDRPLFALRRARDDRPIGLADLALLEQEAQLFQGLVMPSEHQTARGVAVEPMRERGLARQAEAQRVKIILEASRRLSAPHERRRRRAYRGRASARRDRGAALLFLPASWEEVVWPASGRARIGRRRGLWVGRRRGKKAKAGLLRRLVPARRSATAPSRRLEPSGSACRLAEPAARGLAPAPPAPKQSWLSAPDRSAFRARPTTIARGVTDIFTKRKLDAASLDDLEDVLIQADLGLGAATRIREAVGRGRYEQGSIPTR